MARKDKASAGMVTLGRQVKGSQFDTASRLKVCDTDVRARSSLSITVLTGGVRK